MGHPPALPLSWANLCLPKHLSINLNLLPTISFEVGFFFSLYWRVWCPAMVCCCSPGLSSPTSSPPTTVPPCAAGRGALYPHTSGTTEARVAQSGLKFWSCLSSKLLWSCGPPWSCSCSSFHFYQSNTGKKPREIRSNHPQQRNLGNFWFLQKCCQCKRLEVRDRSHQVCKAEKTLSLLVWGGSHPQTSKPWAARGEQTWPTPFWLCGKYISCSAS